MLSLALALLEAAYVPPSPKVVEPEQEEYVIPWGEEKTGCQGAAKAQGLKAPGVLSS